MKQIFLLAASLVILIASCPKAQAQDDFIHIKDKQFYSEDSVFYSVMLNYMVEIREFEGQHFLVGIQHYEDPSTFEGNSIEQINNITNGHLELIQGLGFNTVRLVFKFIATDQDSVRIAINEDGAIRYVGLEGNENIVFEGMDRFVELAKKNNLRIMVLLNPPFQKDLETFTVKMLERYQDEPTIFSYDFFNEPLYFDNYNIPPSRRREKQDIVAFVERWRSWVDTYAPRQLMTLGFSEPIEVFQWDQELLPVDFLSFHSYHPLRVFNEIYWYSRYIDKPWMIGETSLPADNDSISFLEQLHFLQEVNQRIQDCGGMGIGWWQFQDVDWGNFEHDFTSIHRRNCRIVDDNGLPIANDSRKDVAGEFKNLANYPRSSNCERPVNYYNMLGYQNILLTGQILEEDTQQPIKGAVIRGWSPDWSIASNTFTDENGYFYLYSNTEYIHFEASAPGMSRVFFDFSAQYNPRTAHELPMNQLPNRMLEYHSISYRPFLRSSYDPFDASSNINPFDFDPAKFANYRYSGPMKTIYLSKIR